MQAWLTGSLWHDETCAPFAVPDYDATRREHGLDWPAEALTMIGVKRLANLRQLTQSIIAARVPGDLIETGVWRGGACIMMRAILFAYGVTDKRVWVADSFAGLPPGNPAKYPLDAGSDFHTYEQLVVSLNEVQENFRTMGFLDDQTVFLPGWFRDTLPSAPLDRLALIRLDGDMYESTLDALDALYPKLTTGGFVIIDDYRVVPACRAAVMDYCAKHGLQPEITEIDGVGVFWRKDAATDDDSPAETEGAGAEDDALTERILLATASLRNMAVERMARALTLSDERFISSQQKVNDLNSDITQRDAELTAIRTSTSWRITRPLRDLKRHLRDLKQFVKRSAGGPLPVVAPPRPGHLAHQPELLPMKKPTAIADLDRTHTANHVHASALHMQSSAHPQIIWRDDTNLSIDGVDFVLSHDTRTLQCGGSTQTRFLIGKTRFMVERAAMLAEQQRIEHIFDMGILHGGSVALYDLIFRPSKIVAIDLSRDTVPTLADYIAKRGKSATVRPYFGVSQDNHSAMEDLLSKEFPQMGIDLIVDDASHLYAQTRAAFNICFPHLKPGGLYIIEDWAWAHWAGDSWQGRDSFFAGKTALSNLLIELFMLCSSRPDLIKSLQVDHNTITVTKGTGTLPTGRFDIGDHYLLRGKKFGAWL